MKNWYLSKDSRPWGPFSLAEILTGISEGVFRPSDLACGPDGLWQSLCEFGEFEPQLFPAFQKMDLSPSNVCWTLHRDGKILAQELSWDQIRAMVPEMMIDNRILTTLIWSDGLSGWAYLLDRPEMKEFRDQVSRSFTSSLLKNL